MTDPLIRTELLSPIEFKFYMLRQMVARAREAKEIGWSYEGMDKSCIANSPGDIYEYLIKASEQVIEEIQQLIREQENGN